jgi:endonuclease/exonuclease/phosphatase family metal-dependent hydrolase
MRKVFLFFVGFVALHMSFAQSTIKMMSYNTLNFTTSNTDRTPYFKTVVTSCDPDILVVQEMTSQAAVNLFYSQVLNANYSAGVFIDGPDTDNAIFYKNELFSFISNTAIPTALRNISQFTIVFKSTGDTLRIYSAHLKASTGGTNEAQRAAEVTILRNITNALGAGKNFIVCGDFNIYKSTEQAYIKLLADNGTNEGYFIDPIQITGTWNNSAYAQYHTQSPRVRQFGGGATGGMDDRFDLLLYSQAIADPGGMAYVANSTWAVGNDGNHYNDSINQQPNNSVSVAVANALHNASDHLPVVARFTFEDQPLANKVQIQLNQGWNGISGYLEPVNSNIVTMLNPLGNSFNILQNLTQVYWPQQGINTIVNWQYKSGYMIKVNADTTLTFNGLVPANKTIQIVAGWNLLPVLSDTQKNISTFLGTNITHVQIIKEIAGYQVFWPSQNIFTLQYLQPKKAYFLKSDQAFSITF